MSRKGSIGHKGEIIMTSIRRTGITKTKEIINSSIKMLLG